MIDLHDFETKQIVVNPIYQSQHGGAFVSENTEYVMEAAQYPAPLGGEYSPLERFNEDYRGGVTYWKFNREKGRLEPENSFSIELPPYSQDLSDFGKLASSGWSFTNSFCSERYVGGIERGRPPFEAGCSAKDTDYLHVINWKKAAQVAKLPGKVKMINGHKVIMMDTADEGGAGLPDSGAQEPPRHRRHARTATTWSSRASSTATPTCTAGTRSKAAIKAKNFAGKDPYGIPDHRHEDRAAHAGAAGSRAAAHPVRLQEGVAYTSLYVDSMVARWDYLNGKLLDRLPIHYNIGHLMTMHGDTVKPRGKYLVSLNKLAIDRFKPVGPLHPQNHQLIDIGGDKMELLYDMPAAAGRAALLGGDRGGPALKPGSATRSGTNTRTGEISPHKTRAGEESASSATATRSRSSAP